MNSTTNQQWTSADLNLALRQCVDATPSDSPGCHNFADLCRRHAVERGIGSLAPAPRGFGLSGGKLAAAGGGAVERALWGLVLRESSKTGAYTLDIGRIKADDDPQTAGEWWCVNTAIVGNLEASATHGECNATWLGQVLGRSDRWVRQVALSIEATVHDYLIHRHISRT